MNKGRKNRDTGHGTRDEVGTRDTGRGTRDKCGTRDAGHGTFVEKVINKAITICIFSD